MPNAPPSEDTVHLTSLPGADISSVTHVLERLSDPDRTLLDVVGVSSQREPSPAALVAASDPLIGFVVAGRYRIRRSLGRGGMGQVYEVEHVGLGKLLALKLLAGALAHDPQIRQRFDREARLASRLSHPNTVHVFDYGTTDGLTWLLMELVEGDDLADLLRRNGPMPWRRMVSIVSQACASLAEAHRLGIVHRDVKPGNLMVARGADGEDFVKVLDFGLAKLREGHTSGGADVTLRGMVVGTPHYMAPEQFRGDPVDARGDVYALGALLYRGLTGHAPFAGTSVRELFLGHANEPPVPPHVRAPERGIPPELSTIILRALEKDPHDRWASADELRSALCALLVEDTSRASRQVQVSTPPPRDPLIATRDDVDAYERRLRKQRTVGRVVAATALALSGYLAFLGYQASHEAPTFAGIEVEPNDEPSQAKELPLGREVRGTLGKRIDEQTPDRDFFRVEVPAPTTVTLRTTALPNVAHCTSIYAAGEPSPLARLCSGRARADLVVPAYRLEAGSYYAVVTQDLGVSSHEIVENVSDSYTLSIVPTAPPVRDEIEPNDTPATATLVRPGEAVLGGLSFTHDVDVVCAERGAGRMRWSVSLVDESMAERGSALEVVELGVPSRAEPHRLAGVRGAGDLASSWRGETFETPANSGTSCVQLRRVPDRSLGRDAPTEAPVGRDRWQVRLERVASASSMPRRGPEIAALRR